MYRKPIFLLALGVALAGLTAGWQSVPPAPLHPEAVHAQPSAVSATRLAYSTYLAGNGDDVGQAIATDRSGNVYVTGMTRSTTFPVISAVQRANGGGIDAFVIKLDPNGHVLYSTYLGGTGDDAGTGIAIDPAGDAVVTGWTHSGNFPTVGATQPRFGGVFDAFVSILSANGARLLFSTYFGGSGDDRGNAIALDGTGRIFIAGSTTSDDLPTMHPFQSTNQGVSDAFMAEFTSAGTLIWSTYYGGNSADTARGIAVDGSGNVYLAGTTASSNFPLKAPLQRAFGGGRSDAWIAKLNVRLRRVIYSTYLGGNNDDQGTGIAVDAHRDLYLTGDTNSADFPTAGAVQQRSGGGRCLDPATARASPCTDVIVSEVSETGRRLLFSTVLGGSGDDSGRSLTLDARGNIYVGGVTNSSNFPTYHALQASFGAGTCDYGYGSLPCSDALLFELAAGGRKLVLSTYLGGPADDGANGVAVGKTGSAFVTGFTWSATFPHAASTHGGPRPSPHAFVAHLVHG